MSVFTMAENMTQLKDTELWISPNKASSSRLLEAHPIYKKIIAEKIAAKEDQNEFSLDGDDNAVKEMNTQPIIEANTKQLKTLQF